MISLQWVSAHHQPRQALATKPISTATDRYAHRMFWVPAPQECDNMQPAPPMATFCGSSQ